MSRCKRCTGDIEPYTDWCVNQDGHPICASCTRPALRWGSTSDIIFPHDLNPPIRPCTPRLVSEGVGFGVEVECEMPARPRLSLPDALVQSGLLHQMRERNWWLKTDGSLNVGLELVSQPYHIGDWLNNTSLTDWMPLFGKNGARSGGRKRCGMHIHATRGQLSHRCIQRLWFLINRNPQFVRAISGRRAGLNNYCRPAEGAFRGLRAQIRGEPTASSSRYYALNLAPVLTVEFRFFAGSLSPRVLRLRLSLLQLLIEYCSLPVVGLSALTVERFRAWIESAEDSAIPESWRKKVRAFIGRGLAKAANAPAWDRPLPPIFNRTVAPVAAEDGPLFFPDFPSAHPERPPEMPVAVETDSLLPLPDVTEEDVALVEQWADELRRHGLSRAVGGFAGWRAAREATAVVRNRQEARRQAQAEARRQAQAEAEALRSAIARAEAHAQTQALAEAQARERHIDSILLARLAAGADQ